MNDPYGHGLGGTDAGPSASPFEVTKSDTVDLPVVTKRLWIPAAGAVKVLCAGHAEDVDAVIYTVAAAGYLQVAARRVFATGTTVSGTIIGEP